MKYSYRIICLIISILVLNFSGKAQWEVCFTDTMCHYCIDFIDPSTGALGGGFNSILYISTDSGTTFSPVYTNNIYDYVADVKMFNTDSMVACMVISQAVNDSAFFLRTDNGGTSWTTTHICELNNLLGPIMEFPSQNTGYLISTEGIFKTVNNGVSWQLANTLIGMNVCDCDFISDSKGYIIEMNDLYNTIDGGITWNQVYSIPAPYIPAIIDFVNDSTGFSVMSNDQGYWVIFSISDYGQTWAQRDSFYHYDLEVYAMKFINDSIGYIGGQFNLYRTNDGGASWVNQTTIEQGLLSNSFGDFVADICMLDDSNGFVAMHCMGEVNRKLNGGIINKIDSQKIPVKHCVFPNPTTGYFTVISNNVEKVEIFNMQGERVLTSLKTKINIGSLPDGVYFLRILSDNQLYIEKIIKQ